MGEEKGLEQRKLPTQVRVSITRVQRSLRFNQGIAGLDSSTGLGCHQNLPVLIRSQKPRMHPCRPAAHVEAGSMVLSTVWKPSGSSGLKRVSRALRDVASAHFGPCCLGKRFSAIPGPRPVRKVIQGFSFAVAISVFVPSVQPPTRAVGPAPSHRCQVGAVKRCCLPQHGGHMMRNRTTLT